MINELKNLLFIDIETVSSHDSYEKLDDRIKPHWDKKAGFLRNEDSLSTEELYTDRGAIYSEFGKVIVIALGVFHQADNGPVSLRVKSLSSHDENELLSGFKGLLENKFDQDSLILCAHNGKEFDFPYLSRRMLINQIQLPEILDNAAKKPWEVRYLDTMEMWKFGDRKNFTSLDLLTAIFDVPSSKSDIDGSMVNRVYYKEDGLDRIAQYCAQDVVATAQLYLRMKCLPIIPQEQIQIV